LRKIKSPALPVILRGTETGLLRLAVTWFYPFTIFLLFGSNTATHLLK